MFFGYSEVGKKFFAMLWYKVTTPLKTIEKKKSLK